MDSNQMDQAFFGNFWDDDLVAHLTGGMDEDDRELDDNPSLGSPMLSPSPETPTGAPDGDMVAVKLELEPATRQAFSRQQSLGLGEIPAVAEMDMLWKEFFPSAEDQLPVLADEPSMDLQVYLTHHQALPSVAASSDVSDVTTTDDIIKAAMVAKVAMTADDDVFQISSSGIKCDITDEELVMLETRKLNQRLSPYDKETVKALKHHRRTLKNRGYAQNCRQKRMMNKTQLESKNMSLVDEMDALRRQVAKLENENGKLRQENNVLRSSGSAPSSPEGSYAGDHCYL